MAGKTNEGDGSRVGHVQATSGRLQVRHRELRRGNESVAPSMGGRPETQERSAGESVSKHCLGFHGNGGGGGSTIGYAEPQPLKIVSVGKGGGRAGLRIMTFSGSTSYETISSTSVVQGSVSVGKNNTRHFILFSGLCSRCQTMFDDIVNNMAASESSLPRGAPGGRFISTATQTPPSPSPGY